MSPRASRARRPRPPSRSTDKMVEGMADWRDRVLSALRAVIQDADTTLIEEVKWRRPSNPDGAPVWSRDGMICIGNVLKNAVRLTFPKGAQIKDPKKLFNARLDSRTVRAIDVHEGETVDEAALRAIVLDAIRLNTTGVHRR